MESSIETHPGSLASDGSHSAFAEKFCVPQLLKLQNDDGGWSFREGGASRVEPTAWAVLALRPASRDREAEAAAVGGEKFLESVQLSNGSWPSARGQTQGSWATSLGCWALRFRAEQARRVNRGLAWLLADLPRESSTWWRIKRRLSRSVRAATQDDSIYGWGWTPDTASWVEPTAYACLALLGSQEISGAAQKRLQFAEKMLYDRMCLGGGWNAGNPTDYGVVGSPEYGPTVWALLALRHHTERRENQESLAWAEKNWNRVNTPTALGLAAICLRAYGRANASVLDSLQRSWANAEVPWTVPELSWAAMALSGDLSWLPGAIPEAKR